MASNSDKDFGKRKPLSVPVTPRPGQPAKRSGHVALLLMGTFAVGSAAYALMPRQNCERPPNAPSPSLLQSNADCPPRSSSSSSHGGGSSSRSSYYGSDSSSSQSSSGTHDTSSHAVQRGGFGSFAHSFGSHFSGGG
jgi:hypothetical protein